MRLSAGLSRRGPRPFFLPLLLIFALAEVLPYVRHHVFYVLGTYDSGVCRFVVYKMSGRSNDEQAR